MKEITIISTILMVFFLFPSVLAQDYTNKICVGNSTLQINNTYFVHVGGGNSVNFTINRNIDCIYGCDSDTRECSPSPFTIDLYIIGGLAGLILLICLILWGVGKI